MFVRTDSTPFERPDWGVDPQTHVRLISVGAGIGVALCLAGGALGWVVAGIPGAVGGAVVIAVVIAAGGIAVRASLLAAVGARPVPSGEAPRLINLVEGRARSEGGSTPAVMLFDRPDPNAFIWGGRRPVIGMSRGAVEGFTRTEIEAVVAHCFARLRAGAGRTLPLGFLLGRLAAWTGPLVGVSEDVAAVAATRYPPALRSALGKCSPARGMFAPAFFAADGWTHSAVTDRMRVLEDL